MNFYYFNLWIILYFFNSLILKIDTNINRNYLSFAHSFSVSIISYFNIYYSINFLLHYISWTYFIWDTIYILYNNIKYRNTKEFLYIYHHVICLFALNQIDNNINSNEINQIFFYGEVSNFFNYIVYHLIKTKRTENKIIIFKIIQLLHFCYFRIYIFTCLMFSIFPLFQNKFLKYNIFILYLLGIFWGIKQFKNLMVYKKKIKTECCKLLEKYRNYNFDIFRGIL